MDNAKSELDGLRRMDPQSLAWIHQRYYPEVYRYAMYRLGDISAADDITSEVFIRLLEAEKAHKGPRTTLRGWLMGTAAHLVNDYFRQAYTHPKGELSENFEALSDDVQVGGIDPVILSEENERARVLRTALVLLTPEQQHVLTLRFGNGYSLDQTAAIMYKTVNAVKVLQFRAIRALRRQLDEG